MKQAYVKGTNTVIVGTLEALTAVSILNGFDDSGEPQYAGDTEVHWNEQKSVRTAAGGLIYVDDDGTQYTIEQIEFREVGSCDEDVGTPGA
ncbi:hypothetical protein K2O51_31165 (plasmid) [Cupriavidus pinatubonensis]|uniref:hypothetical protein n=1 Tax=Cupriavidus pinatubonensis TaxID=248026 RepID=UPI001C72EBA0|nr:hypothetical protein [Cupriavidus pinatubonensis]QYY33707.1 hypothetical protein K2O51_31165 [Cupriavidus pinatubonensis]